MKVRESFRGFKGLVIHWKSQAQTICVFWLFENKFTIPCIIQSPVREYAVLVSINCCSAFTRLENCSRKVISTRGLNVKRLFGFSCSKYKPKTWPRECDASALHSDSRDLKNTCKAAFYPCFTHFTLMYRAIMHWTFFWFSRYSTDICD